MDKPQVIVLGAGVIGLTTALRLLETNKYRVSVWAAEFSPNTTSDAAAASFIPTEKTNPQDYYRAWCEVSAPIFDGLAREASDTSGVRHRQGTEDHGTPMKDFWYSYLCSNVSRVNESTFSYVTTLIDMSVFLPYLMTRVQAAGGNFVRREVGSLREITRSDAAVVVNCTGLGAAVLAGDASVKPILGCVVRLREPRVKNWARRGDPHDKSGEVTYVYPRMGEIICGGTFLTGSSTLSEADKAAHRDRILGRCTALVPALAEAQELGVTVGRRPGRPHPRVELEMPVGGGPPLVHNYGHGGSGVMLSWGCAADVVGLVGRALGEPGAHVKVRSRL